MRRRFDGNRLVVASHNPGKLREIADLIRPLGIEAVGAAALGVAEPEESEPSFEGNAALKARAAAAATRLVALADDSGLVVPALDGAPGILSARWAGPRRDFAIAMGRLERELKGKDDRRAHFVCVLALGWPDGHAETFRGEVHGRLSFPPRGTRGFGYDPVFVAKGESQTFGEMEPERKHVLSHRARAFERLVEDGLARRR